MENLVISSTSTCKHPKLEQLNKAVENMVSVFDAIPLELQMDGLDIIQGVVSLIMQKITHGRITAVKFVPFEKTESPVPVETIKQEPIELDSDPESPEEPTSAENIPQFVPFKEEPVSPTVSYTRRITKTPERVPKGGKRQANKAKQMAAKPVGLIMNVNDLSAANILAVEKALKETKTVAKSPTKKATAMNQPKNGGVNYKTKGKTGTAVKKKRGRKTTRSRKNKTLEEEESETEADTSTEAVNEIPATESRLNAPLVAPPTEFKSSEEIRAMFPTDVMTPKRKKPHWKDKADPTKRRLTCPQCPYFTHKQEDMGVHLMAHTGKISCMQCDKKFTSPGSLKRHLLIHRGEREFSCPVCSKAFYTAGDLRQHAVSHTGERPHICNLCGKTYTLSANLSRHMRVHTGEKPYKCTICTDVAFRDYTSLKFHMLKHTGEKPFKCEECTKQFRTSSDLIRHRRTHSSVRAYTCHVCGAGFKQRATLKVHLVVHTNVYSHECELCSKRFRSKSSLLHHARWHAGFKPYKCETCQKTFSTKSYLAQHQILHGIGKRFQCRTCHKLFNHRANMMRHMRIHSTERRYKCHFCPKAFKYINALSYHEGIHTGVKEMCEKCGASFRTKKALKKHICKDRMIIKEEKNTGLQKITQNTALSLSQSRNKTGGSPLKMVIKISPKKKKEDICKTLKLKPACVRLEKLNIDVGKVQVKTSKLGRRLFSGNLNNEPPAAKRARPTEPERQEILQDVKKEPEDVTEEKEDTVVENTETTTHLVKETVPKNVSKSNLVKSPGKPRRWKKRSNLSRKKSHKKADARAVAGDPTKVVSGDMELSVDASQEIDVEGDDEELDLDLDDHDTDDNGVLDIDGEALNECMKERNDEGAKCPEQTSDGEDFIVSLNEDFEESESQKGEDEDEGKKSETIEEVSKVNEKVNSKQNDNRENVEVDEEVVSQNGQAQMPKDNKTLQEDVMSQSRTQTNSEDIVTRNNEQIPKDNMSQTHEKPVSENQIKEDILKDTSSQSSEEIDVISVMENVMNDFLQEEQRKKESKKSQNETDESNDLKTIEESVNNIKDKNSTGNDSTNAVHRAEDTESLESLELEENLTGNAVTVKTEVQLEEESVKDEILQKLKEISDCE